MLGPTAGPVLPELLGKCMHGTGQGVHAVLSGCCVLLQVTDVRFIDRGRRVLVATQHGVEVRLPRSVFARQS